MILPPLPQFPTNGTPEEKAEWFNLANLHASAEALEARNRGILASEKHAQAQADTAAALMASIPVLGSSPTPHPDMIAAYKEQSVALQSLAAAITSVAEKPVPVGTSTGIPIEVVVTLIQALGSALSAKA